MAPAPHVPIAEAARAAPLPQPERDEVRAPPVLAACLEFAGVVRRRSGADGLRATLLVALGTVFEGVGILLLLPMLATLFGVEASGGGALDFAGQLFPGLAPELRLAAILGCFGALMVARMVILWRRDLLLGRLQIEFVEGQRLEIARLLADARWDALARLGHERIAHLMSADIQRCGVAAHFLYQAGTAAVLLIVLIALALLLAPLLALAALLALGAAALLTTALRRAHDAGAAVTQASVALAAANGRFLSGMKQALAQNLQDEYVARFAHEQTAIVAAQTSYISQTALGRGFWSLASAAVAAGALLLGFAVLELPAALLLTLLVLLSRMGAPAMQLQTGLQQLAYAVPAWRAVTAMASELRAARDPGRQTAAIRLAGERIRCTRLTYRHHPSGTSGPGVSAIDLTLEAGEIVGITGPSGSGKTTLADLIAGLLTPQSGEVRIDDVLLDAATARSWRDRVAYVLQEPVLFNQTIAENLRWGSRHATDAALSDALALAGAGAFIRRLPDGLNTIVGERGARISGGERQRLAIARALLRRPALLILDEATSAIDIAGEAEILANLRAMDDRPAILMIAHRDTALIQCDRVLTIADGMLVLAQDARRAAKDRVAQQR